MTLIDVVGKPTYPLNDPVVRAFVVEHLNAKEQLTSSTPDTGMALLLANAVRNGVRQSKELDLYEESTLVTVIVLYCEAYRDAPHERVANTTILRQKLKAFAKQINVNVSEWPVKPKPFSTAIKNCLPRIRLYGWNGVKLPDGHRSWEFTKIVGSPSASGNSAASSRESPRIEEQPDGPDGTDGQSGSASNDKTV